MTRPALPPIPPTTPPPPRVPTYQRSREWRRPSDLLGLGMTFEQALANKGARVQYISPSGAFVSEGVIESVGAVSVFVRHGQGMHKGDIVATDPRRLRLLPEREPAQS